MPGPTARLSTRGLHYRPLGRGSPTLHVVPPRRRPPWTIIPFRARLQLPLRPVFYRLRPDRPTRADASSRSGKTMMDDYCFDSRVLAFRRSWRPPAQRAVADGAVCTVSDTGPRASRRAGRRVNSLRGPLRRPHHARLLHLQFVKAALQCHDHASASNVQTRASRSPHPVLRQRHAADRGISETQRRAKAQGQHRHRSIANRATPIRELPLTAETSGTSPTTRALHAARG